MLSIAVPWVQAPQCNACYLLGDFNQVHPYSNSGQMNEFFWVANTSVLRYADEKDSPMIVRLFTQHRMHPSIALFCSMISNGGKLINDASTTVDCFQRKAFRTAVLEVYNLETEQMLIVNVRRGLSRIEEHGHSLVNHANADAIVNFIALVRQDV